MKTLVAFYSRSGNTKRVANKISKILKADTDEIIDLKDRSGIIGWLIGGKDASTNKSTEIKNKLNPEKYGLVVIGTPIWAWTAAPAVKVYLKKYALRKKVAFFCTCGGQLGKCFTEMEKLSKKPLAVLELRDKKLDSSDNEISEFCRKLR